MCEKCGKCATNNFDAFLDQLESAALGEVEVRSDKIEYLELTDLHPLNLELKVSPISNINDAIGIYNLLSRDRSLYEAGLDFTRIKKIDNSAVTYSIIMGIKNVGDVTDEQKKADLDRIAKYMMETLKLPKVSLVEIPLVIN